jgi:hypothetical protein
VGSAVSRFTIADAPTTPPSPPTSSPPSDKAGRFTISDATDVQPQAKTTPSQEAATKFAKDAQRSNVGSQLWQGMTLGYGDEIDAASGAAATGFGNLMLKATGGTPKFSAGEAYDAILQNERKRAADFEKEHGWASAGLQLAGGIISPGADKAADIIRSAETRLGRIGMSAAIGAGYGAVSGFGSGQEGVLNRLSHAIWGVPFGAIVGGGISSVAEAAPVAAKLATKLGGFFNTAFKHVSGESYPTAAKKFSPDELQAFRNMAISYVHEVVTRSGKTPKQLTQDPAHLMDKPVTAAEVIGRMGMNQLASISRREGITPDLAESQLRQRLEGTPYRVQEDVAKAASVDPAATQGSFEELARNLRKKATPLYETAYAQKAPSIEDNPLLQEILQRPSVQKGLKHAVELAAEEGIDAHQLGIRTKYERQFIGVNKETGKAEYMNVPVEYEVKDPTWKTWDYIKRGIGSVLSREHKDATQRLIKDDKSRAVLGTQDFLRETLFDLSDKPQFGGTGEAGSGPYRKAVAAGGDPIQLETAYHDANYYMSDNVPYHKFDKYVSKLTPAQLEAFKGGWVNSVFEGVQSGRLKLKDLKSDNFTRKAMDILGRGPAGTLVERVAQEQRLVANAQRMMPGRQSITSEMMEAGKEGEQLTEDVRRAMKTTIRRGFRKGIEDFVTDALFRIVHEARTPENIEVRNEIGKLLRMRPDQLREILEQPITKANKPALRAIFYAIGVPPTGSMVGQQQMTSRNQEQMQ